MFADSLRTPMIVVELGLLAIGIVLLWRRGISPAGRSEPRVLGPWYVSVSDFLLFIWLAVSVALLAQFAAGAWVARRDWEMPTKLMIAGAALHLGFAAAVVFFRFKFDRDPPVLRLDAAAWRAGATTFALALPVVMAVSAVWQAVLRACGVEVAQQDLIELFTNAHSPRLVLAMSLLAVFVAPFTEESLFRAGLFRYARTRIPRWAALLVPALLFAALHMNAATFAPLVALGMVFSIAYERTGNAAVSMIAHGLFNLNTIALILAGVST